MLDYWILDGKKMYMLYGGLLYCWPRILSFPARLLWRFTTQATRG